MVNETYDVLGINGTYPPSTEYIARPTIRTVIGSLSLLHLLFSMLFLFLVKIGTQPKYMAHTFLLGFGFLGISYSAYGIMKMAEDYSPPPVGTTTHVPECLFFATITADCLTLAAANLACMQAIKQPDRHQSRVAGRSVLFLWTALLFVWTLAGLIGFAPLMVETEPTAKRSISTAFASSYLVALALGLFAANGSNLVLYHMNVQAYNRLCSTSFTLQGNKQVRKEREQHKQRLKNTVRCFLLDAYMPLFFLTPVAGALLAFCKSCAWQSPGDEILDRNVHYVFYFALIKSPLALMTHLLRSISCTQSSHRLVRVTRRRLTTCTSEMSASETEFRQIAEELHDKVSAVSPFHGNRGSSSQAAEEKRRQFRTDQPCLAALGVPMDLLHELMMMPVIPKSNRVEDGLGRNPEADSSAKHKITRRRSLPEMSSEAEKASTSDKLVPSAMPKSARNARKSVFVMGTGALLPHVEKPRDAFRKKRTESLAVGCGNFAAEMQVHFIQDRDSKLPSVNTSPNSQLPSPRLQHVAPSGNSTDLPARGGPVKQVRRSSEFSQPHKQKRRSSNFARALDDLSEDDARLLDEQRQASKRRHMSLAEVLHDLAESGLVGEDLLKEHAVIKEVEEDNQQLLTPKPPNLQDSTGEIKPKESARKFSPRERRLKSLGPSCGSTKGAKGRHVPRRQQTMANLMSKLEVDNRAASTTTGGGSRQGQRGRRMTLAEYNEIANDIAALYVDALAEEFPEVESYRRKFRQKNPAEVDARQSSSDEMRGLRKRSDEPTNRSQQRRAPRGVQPQYSRAISQ